MVQRINHASAFTHVTPQTPLATPDNACDNAATRALPVAVPLIGLRHAGHAGRIILKSPSMPVHAQLARLQQLSQWD